MTSPAHTVTFGEGAADVLDAIERRIDHVQDQANDATELPNDLYEAGKGDYWLAERMERSQAMRQSWQRCLRSLLTNRRPDHDGDLHVFPDAYGDLSLSWRYDKSGYHGGVIFHPSTRPDAFDGEGAWQIHT